MKTSNLRKLQQSGAAAPRQRPCNYAEAAGGHRIPAEVQELLSSMGISTCSRDDLIAFLNANSSKEWRNQKGDLSGYSMKDQREGPRRTHKTSYAIDIYLDLADFASDLLKRELKSPPEKPTGAQSGFDGAVAGAQILEAWPAEAVV
eukprot:Skav203649  [mRNA]  locus=scaffold1120:504327:511551:+ [translate_table: standard]